MNELPTTLPTPGPLPPVDRDELARLYREMLRIRRLEEAAAKAYTQRKILGFCHLYIGQESVAVGAAAACHPGDPWIAGYREHGQALARGVSARAVLAELFGKATGCTHGLGGSMHLFDAARGFLGGYGIVGGQVPLAVGVAWAQKQLGTGAVCVCFFGEGAANQGAFFEALCLAQLYRLPVVFVCENNQYAMGTAVERASAITEMSRRALGVGMVNESFEAFDVKVVRDRVGAALEHARSGLGPVLLEARTYRFRGHSMSDPAKYRPPGELEEKRRSDPLLLTEHDLRDAGLDDAAFAGIEAMVEAEVQDAWDFADSSPEPDPASLYAYTYAAEAR